MTMLMRIYCIIVLTLYWGPILLWPWAHVYYIIDLKYKRNFRWELGYSLLFMLQYFTALYKSCKLSSYMYSFFPFSFVKHPVIVFSAYPFKRLISIVGQLTVYLTVSWTFLEVVTGTKTSFQATSTTFEPVEYVWFKYYIFLQWWYILKVN